MIILFRTASIILMFVFATSFIGGASAEIRAQPPGVNAFLMPEPWPIDTFTLTDHKGEKLTEKYLKNKWTFVVFGYTSCTDSCSIALDALENMFVTISRTNAAKNTQVLFVSVDPNDTPNQLKVYIDHYGELFTAATGSKIALNNFASEVGEGYKISEKNNAEHDNILEHSTSVSLVDPHGRLQAFFPTPHDSASVTSDYLRIRTCK